MTEQKEESCTKADINSLKSLAKRNNTATKARLTELEAKVEIILNRDAANRIIIKAAEKAEKLAIRVHDIKTLADVTNLKTMVASEINWYTRLKGTNLTATAVRAFDLSPEWWIERAHNSIDEWGIELMELHLKYAKIDALNSAAPNIELINRRKGQRNLEEAE